MAKRPRDSVEREIMDIIPERFDGDMDSMNARRGSSTRWILSIALGLLMIAAIGVAARHLLIGEGPKVSAEDNIPVIKPDEKPIKTKPEDRGGMAVPNQDKLVYQDLGRGEASTDSEKLMPSAEKPQPPPSKAPAVAANETTASAPMPSPAAATPTPEVPAPPAIAATTPVSQPASVSAPTSLTPAPSEAKKNEVAPAKPVSETPSAPTTVKTASMAAPAKAAVATQPAGGSYEVQLAAMKSQPEAEAVWKKVQTANKDLLGSLTVDIQRADLGAKGVFFRLRAGPLDEAGAKNLCAELAKRNQGCIVARK